MHLGSYIFEFANGVEDLAASRGIINDAARDAEFRGCEVTSRAEVDAVFRKVIVAYNQYYLEAPWRAQRGGLN